MPPHSGLSLGKTAPRVGGHDISHVNGVVLVKDLIDFHGTEVEPINENRQLLDRNHSLGLEQLVRRHFVLFIEDFVLNVPDNDKRKHQIVESCGSELPLEEGEEHGAEFLDRDQTLFIIDQLVELLFQVVKDSIVHHVLVDLSENIIMGFVRHNSFINRLIVALNDLAAHRHRALLLALVTKSHLSVISL